jgi:hypothetical protein
MLRKFFMASRVSISPNESTGRYQVQFSKDVSIETQTGLVRDKAAKASIIALIQLVKNPIAFEGSVEALSTRNIALIAASAKEVFIAKDQVMTVDDIEANALLEADLEDLADPEIVDEIVANAREKASKIIEQSKLPLDEAISKFNAVCKKTGLQIQVIDRLSASLN